MFGAVPQAVREVVAVATGIDMLRELTRAARRIESLEAFQSRLAARLP